MHTTSLLPSITPSHNIIHILPPELKDIIFHILLSDGKIASAFNLQAMTDKAGDMRTQTSELLLHKIKTIETDPANAQTHITIRTPDHTYYPVYLSACHNAQQFALMNSKTDIRLSELALGISADTKKPTDKYVVAVLKTRMKNNSFSFSNDSNRNMEKAIQLIPSVGSPARDFAVRKLHSLNDVDIFKVYPLHKLGNNSIITSLIY